MFAGLSLAMHPEGKAVKDMRLKGLKLCSGSTLPLHLPELSEFGEIYCVCLKDSFRITSIFFSTSE